MLNAELQKIANRDGVVTLGFRKKGEAQIHVTPHHPPALIETGWDWRGLIETTTKILDLVEDKSVRVQMDALVCNAIEEDGHVLIVVSEKGHPIAKSVQRTIRRGLKHIRKHYVDTFTKPALERRTPEFLRTPPAPVVDPEPGTPEPIVDQKTKKIEI
jgi:hypothetical protein